MTTQMTNEGLKFWLLNLGSLEADASWFFYGGNTGTKSDPNPIRERRKLIMISALIEHPTLGLLLYETGAVPDVETEWGEHLCDVFNRTAYLEENHLDTAIARTGHSIEDVKGVIVGHLHIDHAGGLRYFEGTDVPIYVHEAEFSAAALGVASKRDLGVYLPGTLDFGLNWKLLSGDVIEFAPNITLYNTPGHTPGLMGMLLETQESGNFYFSTDQFIFKEHFTEGRPLGWLMRDFNAWHRSRQFIQTLVANNQPITMVYGHDAEVFNSLYRAEPYS